MEAMIERRAFGRALPTVALFVIAFLVGCGIASITIQHTHSEEVEQQAWAADSTWKGAWE